MCRDHPYCIFRDRTIETSEYLLLFNDDDYVGVNVCFPTPQSFKFDADCYLHVSPDIVYEALFHLFEFVVWDAFRKDIRVIFGRFSYDAGFGHTNEPIVKALIQLGFIINDAQPLDPLCTKWLQPGHSAVEQAYLQAGCSAKRFIHSYGRLADGRYYFISKNPLQYQHTCLYTVQVTRDQYCQLQVRLQKRTLLLTHPYLHTTTLLLFPLLIQQITFDAIHHKFSRTISSLRLLLPTDFASWLEPVLIKLGFTRSPAANLMTYWRTL